MDLCGFGDLVCPGGVLPALFVGAGEPLALGVAVADFPGDGDAVGDASAVGDAP